MLALLAVLSWATSAWAASNGEEEWLIVPKDYSPQKAWPMIIVSQNQVSGKQMVRAPYFAAYGGSATCRLPLLVTAEKYHLDPLRVYATGFSRSGHGLLETTWQYPHRFAAIAPVCEDLREKAQYGARQKMDLLKYIQQTPVLLWHGDHDSFLATGKRNYELMKTAGCPVAFKTYPGGHGPDPIYFKDIKKVTDFFDQHVLDPYPRDVTHVVYTVAATRAFWIDAKVGPSATAVEYPVFRVVVRKGNVIDVVQATAGIRQLVFHLNDRIVDMSKPLTVTFEGKAVFTGTPQPRLTVTLHEGEVLPADGLPPLWEELAAVYTEPNETGAHDWLYLDLNTAFADPRLGRPVARRIGLDLGFRFADGPKTARITPASRTFASLQAGAPTATIRTDLARLEKNLPVAVAADLTCFGLGGTLDRPTLGAAGEGGIGQVVVVTVRLTNKGERPVTTVAKLYRSAFLRYPIGLWPKGKDQGAFLKGIFEVAGTRGLSWQYFFHGHHNEPYQVLGFLMLNPGGLPGVTALQIPKVYGNPFYGVRRDIVLEGGATVTLPLLLISVPAPDATAAKPTVPDLAAIIEQVRPDLLKVIQ